MSISEILELIEIADECLSVATGKTLTIHQKEILKQVIDGRKLKEVRLEGYSDLTVQRLFCPELWKLLSEATGQKVSIRTVPLVLKNLKNLMQPPIDRTKQRNRVSDSIGALEPYENSLSPNSVALSTSSTSTRHNLPAHTCSTFVGREQEIAQLLELLSPQHRARLISVDGIGGVGKTSLVVEVAYRCLCAAHSADDWFQKAPTFDVIVFTSAKQHFLTSFSLLQRISRPQRTLKDIIQQIARVLGDINTTGKSIEDQIELVKDALARFQTLLIIDNLETIENPQDVLSFLYCDLPPTVKAIITTRKQGIFLPLHLSVLTKTDALQLIYHETQEKKITLTETNLYKLYERTGGIPIAIHYAVGQIAGGYSADYVLEQLTQANGDLARFCFEHSVALIQGQLAHQLLMSLSLFTQPISREMWIELSLPEDFSNVSSIENSSGNVVERALVQLQELSLIVLDSNLYSLLPLTREYAIAELKNYPVFEQNIRERWLNWCLKLAQTHKREHGWDWKTQDDVLEAEWGNIQPIIEWCMHEGRYNELYTLWKSFEAHIYLRGDRKDRSKCWNEHFEWMDWLIQTAQQRDLAVAAEVMSSRGWLLTALGQPEYFQEADRLYVEAWSLRHHQSLEFQLNLAVNIMALRVHQAQFETVQPWFEQAMQLLERHPLSETERLLQLSRIHYYQGRVQFHAGAYESAEFHFKTALDCAQAINWQRVIWRSRNWLADIAIQQGKWTVATHLLMQGLQIAESERGTYQTAFYQRSLANLAMAQGDRAAAQHWAIEAINCFRRLDMPSEARELNSLLQTLQIGTG
ncbi:AAA family ATPase [Thermocoleostomius sinensis]|uniref:AAA family ATPase n=1 Tax=Thermocoleostomius sinensis A174 TaxID=2016057 RepID=A0A9E9C5P1_9CYAN|nr:AAA family ATPase [Thermocoleostomius sinensis]WAL61366.1 AAA family ATPase [Thermocoleostomius sinensis A174]